MIPPLFLTELCRCGLWLAGIPHLNLHLLRLLLLSGYLALPLIDWWGVGVEENISRIIASDWWPIWHINYKHWLGYNKFWNIAQIRHRCQCHGERVESESCHEIQERKAHRCLLDFFLFGFSHPQQLLEYSSVISLQAAPQRSILSCSLAAALLSLGL